MNSSYLIRSFRILLFPFALVYGGIVKLRNWCYDKKIFNAVSFNLPIINVGNLSVGGTGKSPMVAFLIHHLSAQYNISILSRGYRRKTKGYLLANENTTALEIGDEPFMFYRKFKPIGVAVCEDRVLGVPHLLQDKPETKVIILDDAFQHRAIVPSLHIVLTDLHDLYVHDFFLPTGNLRDQKSSIKRAHIVVVTKCPLDFNATEKNNIVNTLGLKNKQQLFFTSIQYGELKNLHNGLPIQLKDTMDVLLVTGIANPKPIEALLINQVNSYEKLTFRDHHIFDMEDIKNIEKSFTKLTAAEKIIITTEKDAMRLLKFGDAILHLPIYILPIKLKVLFNEENSFLNMIHTHIQQFHNI
jgi:tetraacyldisaccharide 4'-kinase